jgi:protein-L-isoaspartate(D-aspartate) O-methyltransferase
MKPTLILLGLFLATAVVACNRSSLTIQVAATETPLTPTSAAESPQPATSQATATNAPRLILVPPTIAPVDTSSVEEDPYLAQREAMVQYGVIGWGVEDETVIQAMRVVPRHEFIPEEYLSQAYENHPLPIGHGQTISQPYIVALMTQEAGVKEGDIILEIGTGSSYQAAVMAQLVEHVYTIEIIDALAEKGRATLERLGYDNVTVRHADGYFGWEEHAPFDAILVTAAPDHVPQPLIQQLRIGGNMIIPVGPVGGVQTLWRVTRVSEDEARTENLGGVRFVPLTRETR